MRGWGNCWWRINKRCRDCAQLQNSLGTPKVWDHTHRLVCHAEDGVVALEDRGTHNKELELVLYYQKHQSRAVPELRDVEEDVNRVQSDPIIVEHEGDRSWFRLGAVNY